MNLYSKFLLFLFASFFVVSTAFGGQKNSATSEGWTVIAETPVSVGTDQIQGSVTFTRDAGAETRGGGMCLAADLYGGVACESDTDCLSLPVPDRGFRYCAGVNGSKNKTCWARPGGAQYCTRSPANTPGTDYTSIVSALVDGQPVKWIGVACMADEIFPTACGGLDPSFYVRATSHLFEDEQ